MTHMHGNTMTRPAAGRGIMHYQYLSLLLISRITNILSSPQAYGQSYTLLTAILLPAAAAGLIVFLLPTLWMNRINPGRTLTEQAGDALGKPVMYALAVVYALFFVLSAARSVSRFMLFYTSVQTGLLPQIILIAVMFAGVLYASISGVGALSRAGFVLVIVLMATLVFITVTVSPKINIYGVYPPDFSGDAVMDGLREAGINMAEMTALGFLLPGATGKFKRSLSVFVILQTLVSALIVCLPLLVLGDYALRVQYPFFNTASIAGVGIITHLDAVFAGVWVTGAFVQAALMCILCGTVLEPMLKGRFKRGVMLIASIAAMALTLVAAYCFRIEPYAVADTVLGIANAALGFGIPLVCAVIIAIKKRRAGGAIAP